MSELTNDYRSGLAAAMLDEGVVTLGHTEDGGGVTVNCATEVMGPSGSRLQDVAAFCYALTLRESGLMAPEDSRPGVITFADMQPFVARVMKEALGIDWEWADEHPVIEEVEQLPAEDQPVVIFDATLDETSVELAKAANSQGKLVGVLALLDMQRGTREALRREAGVKQVFSVIGLADIIRHIMRTDRGDISQRECIAVMRQLDT